MSEPCFAVIGRVLKPKGLSGEVKVSPEGGVLFEKGFEGPVLFEKLGTERPLAIESIAHNHKFAYVKFGGVDTVEEAETLRDGVLKVETERRKKLPAETFYHEELMGFSVRLDSGADVGTVTGVESYPSCDSLEVRTASGKTALVPMVKPVVKAINAEKKEITLYADRIRDIL
ncbi:MAG: ribosome maturation factor RimM [Fibrobacterota bacterium]